MACPFQALHEHVIDFVENAERRRGPELLDALAEEAHGKGIHGVAGVHGNGYPDTTMHRGRTAPRVAAVLDVVVHEKSVVQHFDAGGGGKCVLRAATQRARCRDAQRRTQPLARTVDEVFHKPIEVLLRLLGRYPGRERVGQHVAVPGEPLQESRRPCAIAGDRRGADYHRLGFEPRCIGRAGAHHRAAARKLGDTRHSPLAPLERVRRTAHEGRHFLQQRTRLLEQRRRIADGVGRDLHERIVPGQPGPIARRIVLSSAAPGPRTPAAATPHNAARQISPRRGARSPPAAPPRWRLPS